MNRLRGALFDWDGVLVDTMPMYLCAWREAFASAGIAGIPDSEWYLREGQQREVCIAEVYRTYVGSEIDRVTLERIGGAKDRIFRESYEPRLFPGALDLLQLLRTRGVRCAVVTGSRSAVTKQAVERLIPNLLDGTVFGDAIRQGKPEPDPYLVGLAQLRLGASECIAVENGPLGIRSARAAGLHCVALRGPILGEDCLRQAGANAVFRSHSDLLAYFTELLATQAQRRVTGSV